MQAVLCALNAKYVHTNPAVRYIKAYADKHAEGVSCHIVEETIHTAADVVIERIYAYHPQVVAFSCYIWNIEQVLLVAERIRLEKPEITIVLGGPEVSYNPERYLARNDVDYVQRGEGEKPMTALFSALAKHAAIPQGFGICYRENGENVIDAIYTEPDLNSLESPYTEEYCKAVSGRLAYFEASRGCPFSCAFCGSAAEPLRERPLESVLWELEQLAKTATQVKFIDRTFNARTERACAITKKLLELYRPGLSWHCEISPFHLPEPLVELWLQAPADYLKLEMGVQSLYPPALAAIGRHGDWEQAEPTVKRLIAAANCHLHLDLIAGLPEDTPEGFAASFHRLHQLDADYLQFGFLKVLPGSLLAATAKEKGLVYEQQAPYRILSTPTMDGDYLFRLGRAERMFNSLYNKSKLDFRQRLIALADCWPGGAMALYMRAAELWDGLTGLNQQDKLAMVARLEEEAAV